jgi:hypothetical protein
MGAQGTATLQFGAFPGKSQAEVVVIGQAGIIAGSLVEAWLESKDTTDHSPEEHALADVKVVAGKIVPGTGFTVYGFNTNSLANREGFVPMPWGEWNVSWVWN